ncbi:hypothetical protein DY000_02061623 [Brassica cretica]|uniref:Pyrroline-5-carboxylate reductase dimerisation domain-containing protein n=1 Tax=Brassica cretica TaxID=69181 RepID=A0ABQ7AW74_BRACR|nr:hypothetical protein DY000_02061623 [Brassica cretica]
MSLTIESIPSLPWLISPRYGCWKVRSLPYSSLLNEHVLILVGVRYMLFGSVRKMFKADEKMFDAVTGLSGSGPAYTFLAIEA